MNAKTIRSALVILAFHLSPFTAHAQETVIIPYDASKPLTGQQPDQRYVPYERFLQLWDAAKAHKRGPVPPDAPEKYVLDNARYDGVLDGKTLQITISIDLHTYGDAWVEVPLGFRPRQWTAVTLDGSPVPLADGKLIVHQAGAHRVVLMDTESFDPQQRKEWSLQTPPVAAALLTLTLPGPGGTVTFHDERPLVERVENGRKVVSAALGSSRHLQVFIDTQGETQGTAPLLTEPDSATLRSRIITGLDWERIETNVDYDLAGASLDHFTLTLPVESQPVALTGPNIRSWKLSADAGRQRLEVFLTAPAKKIYTLELDSERPATAGKHPSPVITTQARRVESTVELIAESGTELKNVQTDAARQIPNAETVAGLFGTYALNQPDGTIAYETQPASVQREAKISTVYQVSHRKIEVIASLTLGSGDIPVAGSASGVPAATFSDLTIPIPAGFDLETVQSGQLRDWWREGDVLHVRFLPATGPIPLVLYLVQQFDQAPASLELQPIRPDGFQKVTGEAVIAAHQGDEATLELTGSAKQIAPENAATDFSILSPLERKRAFIYTEADFHGRVTLAPRPLKLGAAWVTHIQAHEGWLGWQTLARLVVRQGSTRTVEFSLPANVPEARVSGPQVRETSSKPDLADPQRRLYEVALQNDLVSSTDLTIDLEQSAGLPVAALEFAHLEREDGYLATENVSDYEMALQPQGLDVAQRDDLPFLPPLTTGASLFRLRPGWSLGVTLQRLEKTGSRAAFVAWAEITTALRRDGTEWNRIVWHLQNRSLQFLPVRLPAGGELVGARVAGENVRADQGQADGQKVTLIPLIKTRPGDVSYDVEMVWRRTGLPRLGWLAGRTLDDPDLVGITVERTLWNLYLPEDHPLTGDPDRVGNMDAVIAEVNRTEKLSGMLDELKSLNSVVLSRSESDNAKVQAKENFDRLAKDLEQETAQTDSRSDLDYAEKVPATKKRDLQQQFDVGQVQRQLKAELADEKRKQGEQTVSQPQAAAPEPQQEAARSWGTNATYSNKAGAVVELELAKTDASKAGQNQLFLNDSVILNGGAVLAQNPTSQAGREENLRQDKLATDSTEQAVPVDGQGNYFAGTTVTSGTLRRHAEDYRRGDDLQNVRKSAAVTNGDAMAITATAPPILSDNQVVLGSARGNALKAVPTLSATAAATTAPAIPPADLPTPVNEPALADASSAVNGTLGGAFQRLPAVAASLGVKGRVSLDADFPLEGRVWHFKKLKANARLDFRVGSVPLVAEWQRIGWFALAAAMLALVGWLQSRRQARRA